MRNVASLLLSLPLLLLSVSSATGCDGAVEDEAAARCAEPPASAVTTRANEILRLDVVELGERTANRAATFASIGMNLDGRCTTDASSRICARSSAPGWTADGEAGIDNGFGRELLPWLTLIDATPSETASGQSFLVFEDGGRATLHLSMHPSSGITVSIPLTSVRLDDTSADGLVTLAAIIPRADFRESVRTRGNALVNPPTTDMCSGATLEGILSSIDGAADILLGDADPELACDGISIGLRFRGTPVSEPPKLLPTCEEQLAIEARDKSP